MLVYEVPTPKKERKTSDAQLRAIEKYNSKFERINLKVVPELKRDVEKFAKSRGMSMTAFIVDLIKKEIYESR